MVQMNWFAGKKLRLRCREQTYAQQGGKVAALGGGVVSIHLFSTSVSLFLPCKPVHLYHFSRFHIYMLIYDICFPL